MAMDIGAGAGGAVMLQDVLRQLAEQAYKNQSLQHEAQRIKISQQSADDNSALRKLQQESVDEDRRVRQAAERQHGAEQYAASTPIGTNLSPEGLSRLGAGGMAGPEFVQHADATLPSTNLSGAASLGKTAPRILGLAKTANPGQGAKDTFLGTSSQKAADQARQDRLDAAVQARQDKIDTAEKGKTDREDLIRLTASLKPAPQAPLVMVQTVDAQGNPVTRIVKKEANAEYVKPANATTATRTASAETVNEVGSDIIRKLADPKFAAVVGPAMGRAGTLRDLIGNPPPEFSELAGQIESYALANMGVHGMRSTQGAEAIKKLLDAHHTPQSLAATIRGLNDFSTRFVQNNKPKSGGSSPTGGGADPLGIRNK